MSFMEAVLLINCIPGKEDEISQKLRTLPWIKFVYLVYGTYDIVVIIDVPTRDDLRTLVTKHIRGINGILSTTTLLVYERYEGLSL